MNSLLYETTAADLARVRGGDVNIVVQWIPSWARFLSRPTMYSEFSECRSSMFSVSQSLMARLRMSGTFQHSVFARGMVNVRWDNICQGTINPHSSYGILRLTTATRTVIAGGMSN